MYIHVNGHKTYAYTGGKDFNPAQRSVVLIHGVLCDHSVWALQSRYLANHGWNVLAIDLPGHCKSAGPPPATVQEAAAFVQALLDAQGVKQAALVGHSFGSLIALQTAANMGLWWATVLARSSPCKPQPIWASASAIWRWWARLTP